jgi:membrane-associated phospholipid phosphatase
MATRSTLTRRVGLLAGAFASFTAVAGLYRCFVTTATGQRIEHLALTGSERGRSKLWETAGPILDTISLPAIGAILVIATVVALARKRWFDAGLVFLAVGGATMTTQILKRVLVRPDTGLAWTGPNSFPSGHTTMAAVLTAALLIIAPERWRGVLGACGALFTSAIGVSTLVGAWHRPSDVIAAISLVTGWYLLARVVQPPERRSVVAADPLSLGMGLHASEATVPTFAGLTEPSTANRGKTEKPFRAGRAVVVGLIGIAIVGIAIGAVTLFITAMNTASPGPGDYLLAYGGGVAAVLGTTALAFAVMAISVPDSRRNN